MKAAFGRYGIITQIAVSLFVAAILVTVLIGEYERRTETKRLEHELLAQADLTVSLITGLMLEPIIVQDRPVLESAMQETLDRNPQIQSLAIFDYFEDEIARRNRTNEVPEGILLNFSREIFVENEPFGRMELVWSTGEGQKLIDENVRRSRIVVAATVAAISLLFVLLANAFAMRPLRAIHARMVGVLQGQPSQEGGLTGFASREFRALDESVSILEKSLTERDEREAALNSAREHAVKASQAKSEFLANMSHEIRTPMNGVIGMAELILETDLDEDQKMYAETISKSGSALLTIINDILNFSKIESGKLELEIAPFDLQTALEDVVTLLSAKACEKDVEITLRYDPELPRIFDGDVGRLRQIVTNVAGNALKFTLQGFVLIDVKGRKENGLYQLTIEVSDTGIGIPPEKLDEIFDEFAQAEGAKNRKFEGTGLGLAISRKLAALMGGAITATSTEGQGSTFSITLPLVESANQGISSVETPVDLDGRCILVVDDLEINRRILSERLTSWGVQVTLASNGRQALDLAAERNDFDVIVQDFNMPGMDGEQLAREIRQLPVHKNTPLIVLSSIDQSLSVAAKVEIGQCDVLQKPIRSKSLRSALSRALQPNVQLTTVDDVKLVPDKISAQEIRILIAEDNKTNALLLKSMLKDQNCELEFAINGEDATEKFKYCTPDLVLMDMSMPVMDGVEATSIIRKWERDTKQKARPIIALTANVLSEDMERCFSVGMDDFLSKPLSKKALLETIMRWSGAKATSQSSFESPK